MKQMNGMRIRLKSTIGLKRTGLPLAVTLLMWIVFSDQAVFLMPATASLLGTALVLLVFLAFARINLKHLKLMDFLFLGSFAFVALTNYEVGQGNYIYLLTYGLAAVIFLTRNRLCVYWKNSFLKFLMVFGFAAMLATYLFYLAPSLYTPWILNRLTVRTYYDNLVYAQRMGYQAGFAWHYTSNGTFLMIMCGVVFAYVLHPEKRNRRLWMMGLLVLSLLALFLTAKRAHILFSVAALFMVYYVYNSDRKRSRILRMMAAVVGGLAAFVAVGQFVPSVYNFIERFIEATASGNILKERDALYLFAMTLFAQNPAFGNGWGSYKYLQQATMGDYNNAHNVFLQLLAEGGMVGCVLFTVIFVSFLVIAVKNYALVRREKQYVSLADQRLSCFALFMQTFFLLYCFTGNPLYDRYVWVTVVLSAAVSMYVRERLKIIRQEGMKA